MTRFIKFFIKIFFVIIFFFLISCKRYTTLSFPALGTVVTVTLPADNNVYNNYSDIREIVYNFQSIFNRYDDNSLLSRFNKGYGLVKTSPYLCEVISYSKMIYEDTSVFDVTLLPLIEIWDYKKGLIPNRDLISSALKKRCMECLVINTYDKNNCILEKKREIRLDLGGIAKGYIIQKLYEYVSERYKEGVINIGGDVFVFGRYWDVYILDPKTKKTRYKVKVKDKAVFTSGDYERFFVKDGRLYSHILDPRTGEPVLANFHSVTVIGDNPTIADGLATSFFILGPEASSKIIKEKYNSYSFMFIGDTVLKSDNFIEYEEIK